MTAEPRAGDTRSVKGARLTAGGSAVVDAPPYGSPEWVTWRNRGLGASDLPTVVGVNPYQSEYELAAVKRGLSEPFAGNARTAWGHRMEAVGIEVYRETTGAEVVTGETLGDPRWPHLWATLDGRAGRVGIEVKWTARWDALPRRVEVQALAGIGLADLDAMDVVRLSAYGEPLILRVERDDAAIADLLPLGEAWYVRYVLGDEMPPLDDSAPARAVLARLRGDGESQADERQAQAMRSLRTVRRGIRDLEAADRALVRDIKQGMAGTGVLVGDGFRVTWSPVKGRTTMAWQQIAEGLRTRATPEEWDALLSLHTMTGEPGDAFRPTWEEEE